MEKTVSQERQALNQRLAEIAGPENVITEGRAAVPYEVDGLAPETVVFATTTEQVSQIVKIGNQSQVAIIPWGSGSKQQVGPCLSRADIILCLKPMNKVIELDASNFSVMVEAGITNGELQKQLVTQKLFLPLDPPFMETSTIGGELAANASGPLRAAYGTARDIVLGMTVVNPTGDIIHIGGKTMKNVAGIDLCKLLIGSWGTLGIITEVVLRAFPIPEVSKHLCAAFPNFADAYRVVSQLLNSPLTPSAVELIDGVTGRNSKFEHVTPLAENDVLLMVDIKGSLEEVERHRKEIISIAKANQANQVITLEAEEATNAWKAYRGAHQSILSAFPSTIQGKASVPLNKSADMFKKIKEIGNKYRVEIGIRAHGYNGILYPYILAADIDAVKMVGDLRDAAASLGGYFIVETAPLWVRKQAGNLPRRDDYVLMKRIKAELDPNNVLNPGRVVGG